MTTSNKGFGVDRNTDSDPEFRDDIVNPFGIERPCTPSPDSPVSYGYTHSHMPYGEMEPLDQMIFDMEAERLTQLEFANEVDEEEREIAPDCIKSIDQMISGLQAESTSYRDKVSEQERTVRAEFSRRDRVSDADERIHHFNWFGKAIYRPSSTPPELSLALMMSDPKIADVAENPRIYALLNLAHLYIDPVIITSDFYKGRALNDLFPRPYDLQRGMSGHVAKYYTPHGLWTADSRPKNGMLKVDVGSMANYRVKFAIGNGFYNASCLISWEEWKKNCRKVETQAKRSTRAKRFKKWSIRPSPLRQVMTIVAEEVSSRHVNTYRRDHNRNAEASNVVNRRRSIANAQISRNYAEWDSATNPDALYSFPFAEPRARRGKGVKGAFQKASRSALYYFTCGTHR